MEILKKIVIGGAIGLTILGGLAVSMHRPPQTYHINKTEQTLGQKIRVMTANIARGHGDTQVRYYFIPSDKSTKGMRVLETIIREENIDIGCFQEIENAYTHEENQPEDISNNTQLRNYIFGENFSFQVPFMPSKYFADGIAISSRAKLHDPKKILFYEGNPSAIARTLKPIAGIRSFLHATVDYENSSGERFPITIICMHLSSFEFDDNEREFEMKKAFKYAAEHTPAIVLGDFNTVTMGAQNVDDYYPPISWWGTYRGEKSWQVVKEIESKYGVVIQADPRLHLFDPDTFPTMPTTNPGPMEKEEFGKPFVPDKDIQYKVIDYIVVVKRPDDLFKLKLNSTEVYHKKRCSDHTPVIADIEVIE